MNNRSNMIPVTLTIQVTKLVDFSSIRRNEMKAGMKLYYNHALGKRSFVSEATFISGPDHKGFIKVEVTYNFKGHSGKYITTWSMLDCNMIPNKYNDHRLFSDKLKSELYLQYCKDTPDRFHHGDYRYDYFTY